MSVGLPVFDGERYLPAALDSLCAQTFEDFELIVCDNGSRDATEEICRDYAARDARLRYHRSPTNLGAAPNFNRAFELAHGEYFKWAAHDDRCRPRFLETCVAALDADPGALLAYPRAAIIDEQGRELEVYGTKLPTDSEDPVERYVSLLHGHKCFEVFGLVRRAVLARTPLIGSFTHGDGVLLARLSLLGRFVEVPEVLFEARRHDQQSMAMIGSDRQYAAWFDARQKGGWIFPQWRIHWEYLKALAAGRLPPGQSLACLRRLGWYVWARRRLLRGELSGNLRRALGRRRGGGPWDST